MAFLTIDGDLNLQVVEISEQESLLIGDEARADDGTLRGAITDEKRRWHASLNEMTEATLNTLRSRIALGAHVSMTGDAVGGTIYTVRVKLRDAPYVYLPTGGFLRTARLEIEEV